MLTELRQREIRSGAISRRLHCWFGRLAALVAIDTDTMVLVGWATDIETLKRIELQLVAMNPMTASCLVLSGAAIACHYHRRPQLGGAIGLAVAAIALAKLVDLAIGALPAEVRNMSNASSRR